MSTHHMKTNNSFENQVIETIKRSMPTKRLSDTFTTTLDVKTRQIKQHKYEDTENYATNQTESIIKYVPTRREVDSLVIDNYLFQRVSATNNKDGSVGWRCKEYRRNTKCQSTCRIGPNGEVIRRPGPHNHPHVTDAELVFMKAKADAKKRCRTEDNISVQKIFLQEMGKAIIKSGLKLTPEDLQVLPKFEANKRCLQIQRKMGSGRASKSASVSENGDDMSVSSFDEKATGSMNSSREDLNEPLVSGDSSNASSDECSSGGGEVKVKKEAVEVKPKKAKNLNSIVSGLWDSRRVSCS